MYQKICVFPILAFCITTGCANINTFEARDLNEGMPKSDAPITDYVNLKQGSALFGLAADLDKAAIDRSAAVQEVRAAQARLAAREFDRLPSIQPTGSVAVSGNDGASFGIALEQVIWDNGRNNIRLTDAAFSVAEASLRAWTDRNSDVYSGLEAYINYSRFSARITSYKSLENELNSLAGLLELRAEGGIADRGELLRMDIARRELQREIVTDQSALRQAQADIVRYLPEGYVITKPLNLVTGVATCQRNWPTSEAPEDAISRIGLSRTRLAEAFTRAQRFPSLVLRAGSTIASTASIATPGVSLDIDAGDILGLDGKKTIEAATLDTQAAYATYEAQKKDTLSETTRLEDRFEQLQSGIGQLSVLEKVNRESISLYREQLEAGSIPLTEGIGLFREATDTQVDIVDFRADILLNCLLSSQKRGLLAPFQVPNEPAD